VESKLQKIVERKRSDHQHEIGQHAKSTERDHGPHGAGGDYKERSGHAADGPEMFG
jgi:hypothetical protein